ncbi:MAG: transposase [Cellvibrionaceae bacterium]|nr:transposase [Cellvibrionaceae bacterium]
MAIKREVQVCLESTPYYHCYVRCVRRAFLCGNDQLSGENYDHRKQWVVSRLKFLSYIYAVDICAYAVMSNHYHVVLHVDKARALSWSKEQVVERWMQVYAGDTLVDRWQEDPESLNADALAQVNVTIAKWRERLYSISWFMRGINETVARMANQEDNCKGRFWEGRFKSQALLDEVALLSCMAYVDLNPLRAGVEDNLMDSDFSSIQQRLYEHSRRKANKSADEKRLIKRVQQQRRIKELLDLKHLPEASLMPFSSSYSRVSGEVLPFSRDDYFELLYRTSAIIQQEKAGFAPQDSPEVLKRFNVRTEHWLRHVKFFNTNYGFCVGRLDTMRNFVENAHRALGKGVFASSQFYR